MKKQTAVEWLGLYIKGITTLNCDDIIEKALEMEKQQHNVTWKESRIVKVVDTYHEKETSFDDYYAQIFKSDGETLDRDTTI